MSITRGQESKAAALLLGSSLFLCAVLLRVLFVQTVLEQHALASKDISAPLQAGFLTNDSQGYLRLAEDFFGGYFGAQAGDDALLRTPGYPAFGALFYSLGLGPGGILIAQAVIAASVPVMVMLFAQMMTDSLVLGGTAGLLSAISPTGIGLCGLIMSDMLLAVVLVAGMLLFYSGSIESRSGRIIASGVAFSFALMVKPILLLWPAVMLTQYVLYYRSAQTRACWKAVGTALAIQVLVTGLWCGRNYIYEHTFTLSSVTTASLHNYLRPRVEEWAKVGKIPRDDAVSRNRDETMSLATQHLAALTRRERIEALNAKSFDVLRANPLITLRVLFQDIRENTAAGWDYFSRQLPLHHPPRDLLVAAARLEALLKGQALLLSGVFFCGLLGWVAVRPIAANRRLFAQSLALIIAYVYFAILSGTTFWTGSRIMYPVEFILILLVCIAGREALRLCTSTAQQLRLLWSVARNRTKISAGGATHDV